MNLLKEKELRNKHKHMQRSREKERRKPRFLDGFKPDSKQFLRDRDLAKLNGKLYKLCIDFQALKIELEIGIEYLSRERFEILFRDVPTSEKNIVVFGMGRGIQW